MSFNDDLSDFGDDLDADSDYPLVCFYCYYLFMIHRFRYRVAWMGLTDYFNLSLSIFTFKKIKNPLYIRNALKIIFVYILL